MQQASWPFLFVFWGAVSFFTAEPPEFERYIQPIFATHCQECHGPNKQRGGFRIDRSDSALAEADSGEIPVIPGDTEWSNVLVRMRESDQDIRMPPAPDKVFERMWYDELDDIVNTTGRAMLGLTLGCARCHDHKFDAIPTRDYYRMADTFAGIDRQRHPPRPAKRKLDEWVETSKRKFFNEKVGFDQLQRGRAEMASRWAATSRRINEGEQEVRAPARIH